MTLLMPIKTGPCGLEASVAEDKSTFRGEIFIDFELQAELSSGRSIVPSRAN